MYCPVCAVERAPREGRCPFCGTYLNAEPLQSGRTGGYYVEPNRDSRMYTPARGDVLGKGRYRLLGQVRLPELQTSSGKAWGAVDGSSRHQVIIREVRVPAQLDESASSQEQALEVLTQRLVNLGQHPSLPKLIDRFKEQGSMYFVFEHIDGESLATLLSKQGGALSERRVTTFGCALCEIVSFFSQQNPPFVHGSINPETVIIDSNGRDVSLIHLPLFAHDIQANRSKGPASYFAPEQLQGMASTSSDLYAVAATLYHAVTSSRPSDRIAFFYPPARRLNPAVTPTLETILARQLRMSVAQRYLTAQEMHKDLLSLLASYPDNAEGQEQPVLFADPLRLTSQQRHEVNRNTSLLNIGVFVAVIVLILVGVLFAVVHP